MVDVLVDGELLAAIENQVREDIRVCRACAALVLETAGLKRMVRPSAKAVVVPAGLWRNARSRIGARQGQD